MRIGIAVGWVLSLALAGCVDDGLDVARTSQPLIEDEFELADLGIVRRDQGVLRMLDNCMLAPEDGQARLVYFNPARGSARMMYVELRDGFGADAPVIATASTYERAVDLYLDTPLSPDRPVQLTVWEGTWEDGAALPWAGGYHQQVGQRRTSRDAWGGFIDFDVEFHVVDRPCFPGDPGECIPPPPPPCAPDPLPSP